MFSPIRAPHCAFCTFVCDLCLNFGPFFFLLSFFFSSSVLSLIYLFIYLFIYWMHMGYFKNRGDWLGQFSGIPLPQDIFCHTLLHTSCIVYILCFPFDATYLCHTCFLKQFLKHSQKFATVFGKHLVTTNMPPRKKRSHTRKCLPKMLKGKSTLKGVGFSL
jgi:hypothetical protein